MGTDDAAPHIVLTLVHGTWARGAAWTRPESPFRIMIQDELCGLGAASVTVISDFEWSGLNRHEDRREAALALQCKLKTVLAGRPNAFHFLIGHSHGGNIILRAILRWPRLQETLCGAICIATPFLRFRQQSPMLVLLPMTLGEAWERAVKGLLLYFLLLVIATIFYAVTFPIAWLVHWMTGSWGIQNALYSWLSGRDWAEVMSQTDPRIYVWVSTPMVLLLGAALLFESWKVAVREFAKDVAPERRMLLRRFAYFQPSAPLTRVPVLALSSLIDEAYGALVGSWWTHQTATLITRALGILMIGLGMGAEIAMMVGVFYLNTQLQTRAWGMFVGHLTGVLLALGAVISLPVVGLATFLLAQACRRFGPGLSLSGPESSTLISSRAHRVPYEHSNFRHIRFSLWRLLRESKEMLFHSRLYSCRPAIRIMAEWIIEAARVSAKNGREGPSPAANSVRHSCLEQGRPG
jgi:hypothetical protein